MYNVWFPSAGVTAATGAVDQEINATTGNVWAYHGTRVKNTTLGPQTGVDTANANIMIVVEGICVVTVSGTLELYHASEEANTSTVMADSSLILTKTS